MDPADTTDNRFVLTDGYNGTIFLAWKDKRIVVISGLAKDQAEIADKYTSEILNMGETLLIKVKTELQIIFVKYS